MDRYVRITHSECAAPSKKSHIFNISEPQISKSIGFFVECVAGVSKASTSTRLSCDHCWLWHYLNQ